MSQQTINVGASPNDGTGTPLRTAFQYTNSNFSELYTAVGPSGNNIVVPGTATITGDLTVDTSTLKVDSANDAVGIGTTTPNSFSFNGPAKLVVANNALAADYCTLTVASGSTGRGHLAFANGSSGTNRYNGAIVYDHTSNYMAFHTLAGAERLRIDSSGNVGIGVTPSAWTSSYKAIQIGTTGSFNYRNFTNSVGNNYYNDGTNDVKIVSGYALKYEQNASVPSHSWWTSTLGTGAVSWTQAMTLDASGNLLVGTTTTGYAAAGRGLVISGGSTSAVFGLRVGSVDAGYLFGSATRFELGGSGTTPIVINNGGDVVTVDTSRNVISNVTATPPTLGVNSQMVFNLTSNTNLRISVRGTDGTTRTANITLA